MKKHLSLLFACVLGAVPVLAQWDLGLGAGINNYFAPKGTLDDRYRLPDGGATIVPALFVHYHPRAGRWWGIEGFLQQRESWFIDQDLEAHVVQQDKSYGLRLMAGNAYPLSDRFSMLVSWGVHAERIAERAYFSRVFWVQNKFNNDFGQVRYYRFGASFEIAGKLHTGHLIGMWFLRFEGDVIATDARPFDRNRYVGFTTGLRVPVLVVKKK